jgi:hypothetical protein
LRLRKLRGEIVWIDLVEELTELLNLIFRLIGNLDSGLAKEALRGGDGG